MDRSVGAHGTVSVGVVFVGVGVVVAGGVGVVTGGVTGVVVTGGVTGGVFVGEVTDGVGVRVGRVAREPLVDGIGPVTTAGVSGKVGVVREPPLGEVLTGSVAGGVGVVVGGVMTTVGVVGSEPTGFVSVGRLGVWKRPEDVGDPTLGEEGRLVGSVRLGLVGSVGSVGSVVVGGVTGSTGRLGTVGAGNSAWFELLSGEAPWCG